MSIRERLSGNEAAATAMKQINPDVVAAFPITPSTEIPQYFSSFVNNGLVDTEQKLQLLSDSLINSGTFYIDSISFDKPILRNKREDFALIDDNIIYEVIKKYFEQGKYFIYYSNELTEQLYSDASSHSTIVVCYGE